MTIVLIILTLSAVYFVWATVHSTKKAEEAFLFELEKIKLGEYDNELDRINDENSNIREYTEYLIIKILNDLRYGGEIDFSRISGGYLEKYVEIIDEEIRTRLEYLSLNT